MTDQLEDQIRTAIEHYAEQKSLDQETQDFIFNLVTATAKVAAQRDICQIALRMYDRSVDNCNIKLCTGVSVESLVYQNYVKP